MAKDNFCKKLHFWKFDVVLNTLVEWRDLFSFVFVWDYLNETAILLQ